MGVCFDGLIPEKWPDDKAKVMRTETPSEEEINRYKQMLEDMGFDEFVQ